jgi:PAS domain S-box-containing protein
MPNPLLPTDEGQRLNALASYGMMDSVEEELFDDLTRLTAATCGTSMALISLVDERRQWFKSRVGLDICETPREHAFCVHALGQTDLLIVPDTTRDPRFAGNPLVTGEPHLRFYAGAPLVTPEGWVLGTLCVLDNVPRDLTSQQKDSLQIFGRQVMAQFELRRKSRELQESERSLRIIIDTEPECVKVLGRDGSVKMMNHAGLEIIEAHSSGEIVGRSGLALVAPEYRAQFQALLEDVFRGESGTLEHEIIGLHGKRRWLEVHAAPLRDDSGAISAMLGITRDITERKRAEETAREAALFATSTIDALAAHICVLNGAGEILATNRAWGEFARLNPPVSVSTGVRANYLSVCDAVKGIHSVSASTFATGIRAVLQGERERFEMEYSCHSPNERRWFIGRVTRFPGQGPPRVVVAHENITTRRLAEEALRTSEERLRIVTENARIGLVMVTRERRYRFANQAYADILGLPSADIIGLRVADVLSELYEGQISPRLDRAFSGERVSYELRKTSPSGERHYAVYYEPTTLDGAVAFVVVVITEVTEQKKIEAALREREEQLRLFVDHSPAAMAMFDREMKYLVVSRSWIEGYRLRDQSIIGRSHYEVFPDMSWRWMQIHQRCLLGAVERCDEDAFARADGTVEWLRWEVRPWRQADGAIGGIIIFTEDITQRKRAQEGRKESEQLLRQVVENIHEVFWMTDLAKQKMVYISPGYEKIWGRTCEDLYVSPGDWIAAIHPEDRDRVVLAAQTRQTAGTYDEEYRIVRPDGEIRWIRDRAFPVRDESGEIYRVAGVAEDVTEQKSIEEQFLRAQRMESIGTLAGGIAHDLNNVLGPIIMSVDLLQLNLPDPASSELLDIVATSARRGASMVSQVLSFARGVGGQRVELQARHVIRDVEKIACETFPKQIEVRTKFPLDLWTVIGDPTQLHQVLLNLCVNARDAMPEGGVLELTAENITIDAHYASLSGEARPGPYVLISVEDTGTGIPPKVLGKIFDPFFTTKDIGKGTGLGLSTSLAIVKSHGGFIQVKSRPGGGTKFHIYLPAQVEARAEIDSGAEAGIPRGCGQLILVVDDEAAVRRVTEKTLEAFGYRAVLASDGAEAVAIYATRYAEIAAVLTDMIMPAMDGVAVVQVLQRMNCTVPVIMASGRAADGQLAQVAELGVKHFMSKPYSATTLMKTLAEAFREASMQV